MVLQPKAESNLLLLLAPPSPGVEGLAERLRAEGFAATIVDEPAADAGPAVAIVVFGDGGSAHLRRLQALRESPAGEFAALIAAEVAPERLDDVLRAGADEVVAAGASADEVVLRVRNAIRRQHGERSLLSRRELEALLEITEAATSHLELEELLRVVVDRIAQVVPSDRCSAILLERESDQAIVMASHDVPGLRRLPIDLGRYPELRAAVESRLPLVIDDMHSHPLMEPVRPLVSSLPVSSLVVAPLVAHGDAYGALYLRLARNRAFGQQEQAFVRAAASAVANSVRNARLHTSVREKRDELELAYHERYLELDRVNEQLREANRLKDELLAVCSHDLRAPLNVLLGHARLLMAGSATEGQKKSFEAIERQGLRVLQLVQQILEYGRGKPGVPGMKVETFDLSACARQVAEDLSSIACEHGVSVQAETDAPLMLRADESAIRQVLENLVTNAIKHSPEGQSVLVSVAFDGGGERVRVEVKDRGPGIPDQELPLVFERYRKAGESKGLGLGLAICREVVELHGGEIWAQARKGGGTTFVFRLPLTKQGEKHDARLLVVGVCEESRAGVEADLGDRWSLHFARTAREGLKKAQLLLPDALLYDADLDPGPAAFLSALQAEPGLGEIPLAVLGDGGDHRSVTLPIDPDRFEALVSRFTPNATPGPAAAVRPTRKAKKGA